MATYTDNFNLKKLDLKDAPPRITDLNDNWDIIDEELNTIGEAVDDLTAHVDNLNNPHHVTPEQIGAGRVNPNLLDNWYFANPVNQRGQTEYKSGYTIDRWYSVNEPNQMKIVDEGIQFIMNTGCQIKQFMECYDDFDGKPLTGTILYADGTMQTGTIQFDKTYSDWTLGKCKFFNNDAHGILLIFSSGGGFSIYSALAVDTTIVAIKLELGEQQTLAHQDANGNWVLNEVPKYAEQMAICKQYDPINGKYIGLDYFGEHNTEALSPVIQNLLTGGEISMVKKVQRGSTVISSGTSSDVTISAVNMDKTFVNVQTYTSSDTYTHESKCVTGWLSDSTTLKLTWSSTYSGQYVRWEVVEFY